MENKKTISYLNNKVWYRFLKVLYITGFFLVAIGIIMVSWDYSGYYSFMENLWQILVGLLIEILIFYLIRIIFYYIILGKIKPEK